MADLSITAANVEASSTATTATRKTGEAISQGQAICIIDSVAWKADANSSTKMSIAGIALNSAATGQPVNYVIKDSGLDLGATIAVGSALYLSGTAGGITLDLADLTTGHKCILFGMGIGSDLVAIDCGAEAYVATAVVA
jgi:hypothetical protein